MPSGATCSSETGRRRRERVRDRDVRTRLEPVGPPISNGWKPLAADGSAGCDRDADSARPQPLREGGVAAACALGITGAVFLAIGFVSNAAETALIGVADSNQPAAVLALDQLQGRTPVVWTITALVAVLSLAIRRTGLAWRWLGMAGLFVVWMLVLSAGLWRAASRGTAPG